MDVAGGAGGIVSTTADLTKFIEALFGNKLIKSATLKEMITPTDNLDANGKGIGVFKVLDTGKTGFQHDGGIDGFTSLLSY
ncbi:unnamed protein product, partial [Rotaria sp. Silwood1]